MSTVYTSNKSLKGINSFGNNISSQNYDATLAANTDTSLTVPAISVIGAITPNKNSIVAVIRPENNNVFFAVNAAAAAPAGAAFAQTNSILLNSFLPEGFTVSSGDVLHFFAETNPTNVSVSFYVIAY